MDFRRRFEFGLAWRTLALVAALWLFVLALDTPGLRAGRIVALIIALIALASLWNFIRRTNFIVSRFVEFVRFEDYSQRFSDPSGGGFDVLGRDARPCAEGTSGAAHRGERRERASSRRSSTMRRARC